jgi:hypothetical protein
MNAFLNAKVLRKLYCNTPEGFTTRFRALLLLRRALYGLKEAPLWYQDLAKTLQDLGLKQILNTPCLFANNDLIVFFYVNNINSSGSLVYAYFATCLNILLSLFKTPLSTR